MLAAAVGGGRRLFLRCTGAGAPTVVFDNGLTAGWYDPSWCSPNRAV